MKAIVLSTPHPLPPGRRAHQGGRGGGGGAGGGGEGERRLPYPHCHVFRVMSLGKMETTIFFSFGFRLGFLVYDQHVPIIECCLISDSLSASFTLAVDSAFAANANSEI